LATANIAAGISLSSAATKWEGRASHIARITTYCAVRVGLSHYAVASRPLPGETRSRGIYHFINKGTRNFAGLDGQLAVSDRRESLTITGDD
jgi:hypothetical protein